MFFLKSKELTQRQTLLVGLVLAVLSLLSTAVLVFVFPLLGLWLNSHGIYELDLFLLGTFLTGFVAVQGLILFGFPLYYAQDKKSHMTGFRILVFALLWMAILVLLLSVLMVPFKQQQSYSLEDLNPPANEYMEMVH